MNFSFLDNIDYNYLNYYINDLIMDNKSSIYLKYINEVKILSGIIIDIFGDLVDYKRYYSSVSLNDSISIAYNFFNSMNKNYGYRFLNILNNDRCTRFDAMNEEIGGGCVLYDGSVVLDVCGSVGDIYNIVHEFTHKLILPVFRNCDGNYNYTSYVLEYFLGEVSSILNEFLLDDYILNNCFDIYNYGVFKNNRFFSCLDNAIDLMIKIDLVNLYKRYGYIDKNIIVDFFNSLDGNVINIYCDNIFRVSNDIIKYNNSVFLGGQEYIIGVCLASYFYYEINNNYNYINNIIKFNSIMGDSDYELYDDIKSLCDIDRVIFNNNGLFLNNFSIGAIKRCLRKERVSKI